jgi:hypothetical protein
MRVADGTERAAQYFNVRGITLIFSRLISLPFMESFDMIGIEVRW